MKSTTSDLLMRMYENAIINDPGQPVLITVCRHLRELGYEVQEPENAPGDLRFAQPYQTTPIYDGMRRNIPTVGDMTHQDRITVGATAHGLFLLGMATTADEKVDEDCAMDNAQVPSKYEDLDIAGRRALRGEVLWDLPFANQKPCVPYLVDAADGVKGHYNVGRVINGNDGTGPYLQVWIPSKKEWGTGSGVTWTREFAERVRIALVDGTEVPEAEPKDIMSRG